MEVLASSRVTPFRDRRIHRNLTFSWDSRLFIQFFVIKLNSKISKRLEYKDNL